MPKERILIGKVTSGVQKAAYFTQLDWVQEQCAKGLGFKPYPGTLNLEVSPETLPILQVLRNEQGIPLVPPDPAFCAAKTLPVRIGGIPGAIIIPAEEVNIHGRQILEVLAPVRLKESLGLEDGDSVTLVVPGSTSRES